MATTDNIDRYLDEAFADIPRTPETADLKEEIRGNLQSRVSELEADGTKPEAAAAKAITELGDIHALVDSIDVGEPATRPGDTAARLIALNKVKTDPGYVVRTVIFSLVLAVMLAGVIVTAAFGSGTTGTLPNGTEWFAVGLSALLVAILVVDALRQETSQHFRMPLRRALGYSGAALLGVAGLDVIGLSIGGREPEEAFAGGVTAAVLSLIAFIWLGVTQTNRRKPWVKELNSTYEIEDRFSNDPAAAARFGIYTVVIWIVGIGLFVLLSIVVGFTWSWLALLGALVVFFLVLARMLFGFDQAKK
ncbi:MAG TPA: permease prefix domain 1-containing protein [Galbitalea sp.]